MSCGVFVVLDQPGQAKISDLAHQVFSHKDVGCPQVPVDVIHPFDEGHAIGDLQEEITEKKKGKKRFLQGNDGSIKETMLAITVKDISSLIKGTNSLH